MGELFDHAYAHAVAVLGPREAAVEAAVAAVRRGGRSRTTVLGHARHEALLRAGSDPGADPSAPAADDLSALALQLAATRPPPERAIVDLDTRHGLDRAGLGRAAGLPPAVAADRAAAVHLEWQRELDPAVLARLGPGGCEGLEGVLADAEPAVNGPTLGELADQGRRVAVHAEECAGCRDRLRSMVSVRTLLAQRPLEPAPAAVREAAPHSRLRRIAPPPPLEGAASPPAWRRALMTAAVLLAVAGVGALFVTRDGATGGERVEALTKVPATGSSLLVEPAELAGGFPASAVLRNRSDRPVQWSAEPAVAWVAVEPRRGELAPGEAVPVQVSVGTGAPEGEAAGVVRITGADGSSAVLRLSTSVENPPDVVAMVEGCAVTATVEDQSEVAGVDLHWLETPGTGAAAERRQPLAADTAGFTGRLPARAEPLTWWVSARDARGNAARTPDHIRPPVPACD